MPTLKEFLDNDFREMGFEKTIVFSKEIVENRIVKSSGEIIEIKQRLIQDSTSWARFFVFYIPKTSDTLLVCKSLLFEFEKLKSEVEDFEFPGEFSENLPIRKHVSVYSKRIFIYSELQLSPEDFCELDKLAKSRGLQLEFRSTHYMQKKMESNHPLAFISHEQIDKELIAKPLAQGLNARLCTVLYDEYSLHKETGLLESIERGIMQAKRCILIISPTFLSNQGERKKEFNSIFTPERIFNERIVLPIWVNVSKEQVYEYSPSIADTFGLVWPTSLEIPEKEYKKEVQILISRLHTQIASIEGFHGFR
ncbi:MAG TPA: toll/interleukin-1 receptor domain-containing protein [Puia sp.]|jgi:hypothetical protein|nr:toll/interleukin-1 receptor domain-containing protein [Puia sp.]